MYEGIHIKMYNKSNPEEDCWLILVKCAGLRGHNSSLE